MKINKKSIPGRVTWVLNDNCNYRCTYCCIDNAIKSIGCKVKNYQLFVKNFKKYIPQGWNFTLVGGEPFLHPDFFNIVRDLVLSGYTISIITNFSSSINEIKNFLILLVIT